MTKVILLNGPPRSGKDSLGNHLRWIIPGVVTYKFAEPVKKGVFVVYGIPYETDIEAFDYMKDEPSDIFNGLSFRQACIQYSEKQVKPFCGEDHFAKIVTKKIKEESPDIAIVTDCGFPSEPKCVVDTFGIENVFLIRIHAEERGKSFEKDSRAYIYGPWAIDLYNNGAIADFLDAGVDAVTHEFLEKVS